MSAVEAPYVPARSTGKARRLRTRGPRGYSRTGRARIHYYSRLIKPAYLTPQFYDYDGTADGDKTTQFFTVGHERLYMSFKQDNGTTGSWDTWMFTQFDCNWDQLFQVSEFKNLYAQGKILSVWVTWNPNQYLGNAQATPWPGQGIPMRMLGYVDTMVDTERLGAAYAQTRSAMATNSSIRKVDMGKRWTIKILPFVANVMSDTAAGNFLVPSTRTPWLDLNAGAPGDVLKNFMLFNLGVAAELPPGAVIEGGSRVDMGYFTFKAQIACRETE